MQNFDIKTVRTSPYNQKMGTSGLRAKTKTYMQENYLENFLQSAIDVVKKHLNKKGKSIDTVVLGGDGRFMCKDATYKAAKMLLAAGAKTIIMEENGLIATPAHSYISRKYNADMGFVFTASHNPGGIDGDFGVKVQFDNGGSVLKNISDEIDEKTKMISEYYFTNISDEELINLPEIKLIDAVKEYSDYMESIFDFEEIRKLFKDGFTIRIDSMNAISGPYAKEIFINRLGANDKSLINGIPLPDFGGLHPEPNLLYAKQLVDYQMSADAADFAFAFDGDMDRNLILGKQFFVSPSDSLAAIALNMDKIKSYKNGCVGIARTMPTSSAADLVGEKLGIPVYKTPTGWRFFSNLLDANKITICGEESFGTGSGHIREKDGIWAVLCWLNILAITRKPISHIVTEMWNELGRVYYSQYSYENIEKQQGDDFYKYVSTTKLLNHEENGFKIVKQEIFNYTDPIDGNIATNQGVQFWLKNVDGKNARVFTRLSGTGSVGATIRIYAEMIEKDRKQTSTPHLEYLNTLIKATDKLLRLTEFTGKEKADVYN